MQLIQKVIILVLSLYFFSCISDNKEQKDKDGLKLTVKKINKDYDFVSSSEILNLNRMIPLETIKPSLIGEIGAVKIYKSLIYILDKSTKSIIIFNTKGKFINKIEPQGRGPQEAIQPYDIAFDKYSDQLLLLDRSGRKILCYSVSGEYVKTIELPDIFEKLYVLNAKKIILYSNYYSDSGKRFTIINKKGEIISQFEDIPHDKLIGHKSEIFSGNLDSCLYALPNDNVIYTIEDDMPKNLFVIDFNGLFIQEKAKEMKQEQLEEIRKSEKEGNIIYQISDISLVKNILYFSFIYRHQEKSAFFNVNTGKQLKMGELRSDKHNLIFANVPPIGQTPDELIYAIYPSNVIDRYKRLLQNPEYAPHLKQFSSLFENNVIGDNSNPVLFFYKIKS